MVDHHVAAEVGGVGEERAATVDLGHALDEADQLRRVVQHEGVDGDAALGHALHLLEGSGHRARRDAAVAARPLHVQFAVDEVRRGLTVADHENLGRRAWVLHDEALRDHQAFLEVREWIAGVPTHLR